MSSSEEEEIAPLDIQIEIMKRLPVKSLIKFTSVSKQWKSIIKSSEFIADYNGRSHIQQRHQVFVSYDSENYVDMFVDDDDDDISFLQKLTLPMPAEHPFFEFYDLIGDSQGLFGFHCYNKERPRDGSVVVIWNPSIRKSVFIPVPAEHMLDQTHFVFTVCNATDPMIFKTSYIRDSPRQIEIFTLSTGVWRILSNAPRESLELTGEKVVIDRFIHWIAYEGRYRLILSFDITSEQFTELCLPPTLAADTSSFTLRLSKHKESLVVLERYYCKQEFGVWMMDPGVQNSFRKLYTVKPPCTREYATVLGFRKNGQPIIYKELYSCGLKAVLLFYESNLEHFNEIEISGYRTTAGSYMETLLLLDH